MLGLGQEGGTKQSQQPTGSLTSPGMALISLLQVRRTRCSR